MNKGEITSEMLLKKGFERIGMRGNRYDYKGVDCWHNPEFSSVKFKNFYPFVYRESDLDTVCSWVDGPLGGKQERYNDTDKVNKW